MSRVAYLWRSRRHGRCSFSNTIVVGIILSNIAVVSLGGSAFSQPAALACNYYDARCRGGIGSPLCTQLKQRCDAASNGAAPNRSRASANPGRAVPDSMLEMPNCGPDEELVMVPTCMCEGTTDQDAAMDANPDCASCSSDGTRLSCQKR
jgi:hypothetical protein